MLGDTNARSTASLHDSYYSGDSFVSRIGIASTPIFSWNTLITCIYITEKPFTSIWKKEM